MTTRKSLLPAAFALIFALVGCDPGDSASTESATTQTRVIKGSVRLPDFQNLESLGQGAVFRERHVLRPGDRIHLAPDLGAVHIFDKVSGQRISA